jgi:hypothetical protein
MDPRIREALAIHEFLRRLGYLPDELYIGSHKKGFFTVELRSNGLDFSFHLHGCAKTPETFLEEWPLAVAAWNRGELPSGSILLRSGVMENRATILAMLSRRGIYPRSQRPMAQA